MRRRDFLKSGAVLGAAGLGGLAALPGSGLGAQTPAPAPEPAGPLRLDSNENPLGLCPAARQAAIGAADEAHRYPDALREELIGVLAERHQVGPESVVLGNGSTEILQMVVQSAAGPDTTLILADPTFEAIAWYQRPLSLRVERVPLEGSFAHDIERMRAAARACKGPVVVYLCNPNNPTATLTASAAIDAWIGEAPETTLFAVDEAYFEYVRAPGYRSADRWARERPGVVVTRTFSKIYGMAGLRLGYAVAHPQTARRLLSLAAWDNANGVALAAALAALADDGLVARSRAVNTRSMQIARDCLDELELGSLPSHANFLMHRLDGEAGPYIERMRARGIRVGRIFPAMPTFNRLTLGLPEEMERWAATLRDFRRRGWV